MREKSQLEDMRAAIRGDIERARARREADPWRAPEPAPRAVPEPEPGHGPEPDTAAEEPAPVEGLTPEGSVPAEAVEEPAEEPMPEPEPEPVAEAPAEATEAPASPHEAAEPAGRPRSFFARLFGKS